jgi:hypothetical protein
LHADDIADLPAQSDRMPKDYYKVLGVNKDASDEELKKA